MLGKIEIFKIICVTFTVSVFLGVIMRQTATSRRDTTQQSNSRLYLSHVEESDLIRLAQQALEWATYWISIPDCPTSRNRPKVENLAEVYDQFVGQNIDMGLVITESNVTAYFNQLHIILTFVRLHDLGLGPPKVEGFCETSYDEHLVMVQAGNGSLKPIRDRIMNDIQSNPATAELIKQSPKEPAPAEKGIVTRRDLRLLELGASKESPQSHSWSDVKDHFFRQMVEEMPQTTCGPGQRIQLTIPEFSLGDPSIYILFRLLPSHDEGVEWFNFTRVAPFGEYSVHQVKSIARLDEMDFWRPRIERRKAKELEIRCPEK